MFSEGEKKKIVRKEDSRLGGEKKLHSSVEKPCTISTPWLYLLSHGRVLELLTPFTTKVFHRGQRIRRSFSRTTNTVATRKTIKCPGLPRGAFLQGRFHISHNLALSRRASGFVKHRISSYRHFTRYTTFQRLKITVWG